MSSDPLPPLPPPDPYPVPDPNTSQLTSCHAFSPGAKFVVTLEHDRFDRKTKFHYANYHETATDGVSSLDPVPWDLWSENSVHFYQRHGQGPKKIRVILRPPVQPRGEKAIDGNGTGTGYLTVCMQIPNGPDVCAPAPATTGAIPVEQVDPGDLPDPCGS
jgi:hypothetical protein